MTATIGDELGCARQAIRQGQPALAERIAREALGRSPPQTEAWGLLADAQRAQGRPYDAADSARRALGLSPRSAEAHHRLALLLRECGQLDEAEGVLRRALALLPDHLESLLQLGVMLAEAGRLSEAVPLLDRAVRSHPTSAPARHNLGVALAQAGRPGEAVRELEEALRLEPGYAEAGYNLGHVLSVLKRRDEAIAAYRRGLAQKPDHHGILNNLGLLLQEANRPEEAVVLLRQAARLRPELPEAHNNLGLALADLGRFAEAEERYHEALRQSPRYAEAHVNLGSALKDSGRTEEALACYEMALRLDPCSKSARYNRSLALLQAGRWEEGLREYEHRWGRRGEAQRTFDRPRWDGGPLEGRTILAWTEQGLGDTIQFVRFAGALRRLGARVALECPGYLLPLLSHYRGVDQLVAEGEPLPHYDMQAPLMSLPALLGVTLSGGPWGKLTAPAEARLPDEAPYLSVDEGRVERWRQRLGESGKFRVGVVWQGNPHFGHDRFRSFPLRHLRALAEVGGVELVSLQREHGLGQLAEAEGRFKVIRPGDADRDAPFLDTMALLRCVDLAVCADTAVGHLAGAMGVPVWLALSGVPDWRWLRGRDDTPWYPSMKLFRQESLGDWDGVFRNMAGELRRLVVKGGRGGAARVEMAAGELLDRLTILRIKRERIKDPARLAHVEAELAALERARGEQLPASREADELSRELKGVNEELWGVEDALRDCEVRGDFGGDFVRLARSVYQLNDRRGDLKWRINEALKAPWTDPKQYGGRA